MNSHQRKLIEKFIYRIDTVTLSDCDEILQLFDWKWEPSPGSHRLYRKKGSMPFNLPTTNGRDIKKVYKIKLREFLEQQFPKEFEL